MDQHRALGYLELQMEPEMLLDSMLLLELLQIEIICMWQIGSTVTTLAGTMGVLGFVNATGTSAKFDSPYGITVAGDNLYVADYSNNAIRKVVISTGVVTTLARAATAGLTNATGTAARFNLPFGITTDGPNLYIGDEGNNAVRKIVIAPGVVTTLAGATTAGFVNATGTAARFSAPEGITTDGTNLYVPDSGNDVIRKIVIATGVVTTLAGSNSQTLFDADGSAATAEFDDPQGIVSDGTRLFVADYLNNKIRKID